MAAQTHHRRHEHSNVVHRSFSDRILSSLTLLLPLIFYILGLSFTLKTIYTPAFAESQVWNDQGQVVYQNNSNVPYTQKASPFYTCTPYPIGISTLAQTGANQTCRRLHSWGSSGMRDCLGSTTGDMHICQQLVTSAGLYVSGAVLVGLAVLGAALALLLGFKLAVAPTRELPRVYHALSTQDDKQDMQKEGDSTESPHSEDASRAGSSDGVRLWSSFAAAVATFLAVLSVACLFIAQFLSLNALVEDQKPSGDVSISGGAEVRPGQGPWYLSHAGLVYAGLAWLTAGIGSFIAAAAGCFGNRGY